MSWSEGLLPSLGFSKNSGFNGICGGKSSLLEGGLTLLLIASCAVAAIYIYGIFRITSDLMWWWYRN